MLLRRKTQTQPLRVGKIALIMRGTRGGLRRTAARLIQEISQRGKVEESYHSSLNLLTYREPEGLRRDDSFKRIIKRRNLFEHGTLGFISKVLLVPMMRLLCMVIHMDCLL